MHSFDAPSGRTYLHNGDYSGDVHFYSAQPDQRIKIPFEDIRALYLDYLRSRKIATLEDASDDDLEKELLR